MKKFLILCGVLFLLYVFGQVFTLKHDTGERLINPDDFKAPHVEVKP